jgi:putative ABC transport system permease protein
MPLAITSARLLMQGVVEGILNIASDSYTVPTYLLIIQVAVGLLLPLIAGLLPVLKGTRITTQQALSSTGLSAAGGGQGPVERLLAALQRSRALKRPALLAIRNTLRHKGRLAQTLAVLTAGTALFISVLSVRTSVDSTLQDFMRYHGYDVSIAMQRPYRSERLQNAVQDMPGVAGAETWSMGTATLIRGDGTESEAMRVVAAPADTALMAPRILEGRWLAPGDGYDIVVNSDALDEEPTLQVGAEVALEFDGRESIWRVVGVVPTESRGPAIYSGLDAYSHATRTAGQTTHVQVVGLQHSGEAQAALAQEVRAHLEGRGLSVRDTTTTEAIGSGNELMFSVVVSFLILLALLLAAVGGLGLSTTMSINIMERIREVGVLRAIGASNGSVRRIVLIEGMAIGLLSWLVGTGLSLVLSPIMSRQIGLALLKIPLAYQYSTGAALIWLFALQAVAIVASLGPARGAVRLTVREVLAYE